RPCLTCCQESRCSRQTCLFISPLIATDKASHASEKHQTCRLQILCRSHHSQLPEQHVGSCGAEWLRKIQHHRRRALGDGRELSEDPPGRVDGGCHLQWLQHAQVGNSGQHRACFRHLRRHPDRRIRGLCANLLPPPRYP